MVHILRTSLLTCRAWGSSDGCPRLSHQTRQRIAAHGSETRCSSFRRCLLTVCWRSTFVGPGSSAPAPVAVSQTLWIVWNLLRARCFSTALCDTRLGNFGSRRPQLHPVAWKSLCGWILDGRTSLGLRTAHSQHQSRPYCCLKCDGQTSWTCLTERVNLLHRLSFWHRMKRTLWARLCRHSRISLWFWLRSRLSPEP